MKTPSGTLCGVYVSVGTICACVCMSARAWRLGGKIIIFNILGQAGLIGEFGLWDSC